MDELNAELNVFEEMSEELKKLHEDKVEFKRKIDEIVMSDKYVEYKYEEILDVIHEYLFD